MVFAIQSLSVQGQHHFFSLAVQSSTTDMGAVPAHVINEQVIDWDWLPGSGLKKCRWCSGIEIGASSYWNGHHLTVWRKVEQLLSVTAPTWLFASSNRNFPLAARCRKGCNINFPPSGFI